MKTAPNGLAILGAKPAFNEPLHVGRPNLGDREALLARLNRVLDTRRLSNAGPFVQEFEEQVAERLGVKHCIATCNATVALEIAVRALELSGEVIVPAFTFVATAHALQWQQITPVFCDIDSSTHNIDPRKIQPLITSRTTGILGVHLWGRPCEIDALQAIADNYHLKLLFDAAHALGCRCGERCIGNFGCAEVLSFHATKIVNAGEGGAVVTNDDALAARIRLMKNFGFSDYDKVIHVGTNAKMSEFSAVTGVTNLESMEGFIFVNRRNFEAYEYHLRELRGLSLLRYNERTSPNYHYVVLEIDDREAGLTRDQLLSVLHAEGILARRYFYPGVHRMEPYRSRLSGAEKLLPQTTAVAERVLVLPTGTAVTPEDIEQICAILRIALQNPAEIRDALMEAAL
jgi:dTDP-4-amino-4,6-dideoxygalactose transaminase